MTAQLIGSYSYDSVITGLSLMLMASVLDYGYEKSTGTKPKKLIQIAVICALLGTCKGGALSSPLRNGTADSIKTVFFLKKSGRLYLGGTLLVTILTYILVSVSQTASTVHVSEHAVYWNGEPGYSISWVVSHLGEFIQLFV